MTTQPDALPACVHGNAPMIDESDGATLTDHWQCSTCDCDCAVWAPTEAAARAAWRALCAPNALAASRAECERLRQAAANVAAMYQTDPLTTVDGLTDTDFIMRISALRAALAAQGGDCGTV